MISILILLQQREETSLSLFPSVPGIPEGWPSEGIQYLHVISTLYHQGTHLIQQWTHISLVFLLSLMHSKSPSLLSLTFLARFNSNWTLAFLVTSHHSLLWQYSYIHLSYFPYSANFCLPFEFWQRSFLPMQVFLLDLLLMGTHWSWAQREWCLNISEFSWSLLEP